MSNMEVINAVKHYQRNIEKCSGDVQRMLHCLQKLYRLPVTVQHLQETGVGRTVNALRKYEGDTGEAAKALVNKWKAMVAEAESSEEEVPNEKHRTRTESPPPRSSSHKHKSSRSESHGEETHSEKSKSVHRNHTSSSHIDNKKNEKLSSKSKYHDQGHKRRHEEENRRTEEKRRRKNVVEEEEEEEEEDQVGDSGHESHEEIENESDHVSIADSDRSSRKGEEEEEEAEEEENEGASEIEEVVADEVHEENSDSSSDAEHVPQVKHRSHSGKHSVTKQRSTHSEKISHSNHKSQSSRNHSDGYQKSERSREKQNHSDHRHNKKTEGKNNSSSKTGSKSDNAYSNKGDKLKIKDTERIGEKEKSREREKDREQEREKEKIKSEVKNQEDPKKKVKDEKSKQHIPRQEPRPSTSSSKSSSSKVENRSKSSSPKKVKVSLEGTEDGIDSCSGTSFADALGMMGMIDNISKKKKKVSSSGNTMKKPEGSGSHAGSSASSHKSKDVAPHKLSHLKIPTSPEDLNLLDPSVKLQPLDQLEMEVDVDATLPTINPNYRPLPHLNLDAPSRARARSLTEEEALSQVMSTKNQRTKVYSGVKSNKSWATVPSLFDICVRVLQENIDALEYTGGVPYDLLKPVLILATPDQLFALEHYNPYLIEETDELWESHVRRKFRNERRLDMETHREMFQRCIEESEAKLKALTLNIQNSMAKSVPVRQTKLAYVDSIAKPPRQVARKQAKFGTANATAVTPMAKVQKLVSPATSSAGRSNSPVVHAAPRTSHSAKAKPRMAPLMQKTMKLAKSFKR